MHVNGDGFDDFDLFLPVPAYLLGLVGKVQACFHSSSAGDLIYRVEFAQSDVCGEYLKCGRQCQHTFSADICQSWLVSAAIGQSAAWHNTVPEQPLDMAADLRMDARDQSHSRRDAIEKVLFAALLKVFRAMNALPV